MSSDNAKPVVSPVLRSLIDSGQIQVYTHEDLSTAVSMAPADIVSMQRELSRLRAENERLRAVVEAAKGLAHGVDWNKGTHAKHYRPKLLAALAALDQERKEGE